MSTVPGMHERGKHIAGSVKRNMKFYNVIVQIVAIVASLAAEDDTVHACPLERICAIAESNAPELKIIDTKIRAGYAEVEMYRSEALPNLSFGSGVSYVSQSQATQKMQQAMMLAMFGSVSGDDPSASAGSPSTSAEINYPDRINGYAFNWSLNLHQPLVTFGKVSSALKLARMRYCTLKDQHRLERDYFFLRVMQEFSNAYTAQMDVTIGKAALNRTLQLKKRLQAEYDAGRIVRRELLRIEAKVRSDQAQLLAAEGTLSTSRKRLLQTIGFGDSAKVVLTLDETGELSASPALSGPGSITLFLKKNEAAMYKQQTRYLLSNFFPSINFVGSIANQFMTIDTNGLVRKIVPDYVTGPALEQLAQTFDEYNPKPDKYFDPSFFNYTVGLQLTWNIFDGNRTRSQYRQAKLKARQSLLELDVLDKTERIALEEARNQIRTVDSVIVAVTLQQEATREALEQTEQDYADGITDFSTLLDMYQENRDVSKQINGLKLQRVLALAQLRIVQGLPVYGDNK